VIATFDDHDGYSGVVFGLPDSSRQLELVFREGDLSSRTAEDQLVFFLGSPERVGSEGARIRSAGFDPVDARTRTGSERGRSGFSIRTATRWSLTSDLVSRFLSRVNLERR
jgi:hypothetical protein